MKKTRYIKIFLVSLACISCQQKSQTVVETHTEKQIAFFEDEMYFDMSLGGHPTGIAEYSHPQPYDLDFSKFIKDSDEYIFLLAEDKNFKIECQSYALNKQKNKLKLYNLKTNCHYYYKLIDSNGKSKCQSSFKTSVYPLRNLYIPGVTNCRDLGGYTTLDGKHKVKQGLLYRTASFNGNYDYFDNVEGLKVIKNQLQIKTELDLRTTDEYNYTYSSLGEDINYIHCPLKTDQRYYLSYNAEETKNIFNALADINNYPLAFHCAIGTDRTGILAFCILGLLGVNLENAYKDYLFSNFANIGSSRSIGQVSIEPYVLIQASHSSFQEAIIDYLTNDIEIEESNITAIQNILLEENQ